MLHLRTLKILQVTLFVMLLGGSPAIFGEDLNEDITAWDFHLVGGLSEQVEIAPLSLFNKTYWAAQSRFNANLKMQYWIYDPLYLSHGLLFSSIGDSDASKGISKPGLNAFGFDFAIGLQEKPGTVPENGLGIELRQALYSGQITGDLVLGYGLALVWLETTLRPVYRLGTSHFQIGLPFSISWRKDPGAQFAIGIELEAIL